MSSDSLIPRGGCLFEVGVTVVGVSHLRSFAQQIIRFVEEQDPVTSGGTSHRFKPSNVELQFCDP